MLPNVPPGRLRQYPKRCTQLMLTYKTILIALSLLSFVATTLGQQKRAMVPDTSAYAISTETVKGKKYVGFLTDRGFFLTDSKKQVIVFQPGDYFTWEFKDLDGDGREDIFLDLGGNTPERYDLLLGISAENYRKIEGFDLFPAPIPINGTKYYYSYHKSGCADMNWGSDLFFLRNFKAVRIGSIAGYQCEDSGIKDGLYIYKYTGTSKKLQQTLQIQTLKKYKDFKWGFIAEFWTRNWKRFAIP